MTDAPRIQHFSDLLCVWAYAAHIRLERLIEHYGDRVRFDLHFCSVFPDTRSKIDAAWGARGGARAYGDHVRDVAGRFDHIRVHADVWSKVRPPSSTAPHLFLKAAELAEADSGAGKARRLTERPAYRLGWALRRVFFEEARDIARWEVQADCAAALGMDVARVEAHLRSGEAASLLDRDLRLGQSLRITGSPTFVMNEGRQTLYCNVGYHLLEANIDELLRAPGPGDASWC